MGDLELLYQLKASHFTVRSSVPGKNSEPLGTLRVSNVQAVDLSLSNESPGLLEGLMSKLVVETNSDVAFAPLSAEGDEECESIGCRRVILVASIHECGHLRDMLLFLNSDTVLEEISQETATTAEQEQSTSGERNSLKFGLPQWALYIPWWLYSGRVRRAIQLCLILYTIFSVVWASWQLYRHFNIIQVALQPIVAALKVYLSTVMHLLAMSMEYFTELWTTLLSPLNVLFGRITITPLIKLLVSICSPLIKLLVSICSPLIKLLVSLSSPLVLLFGKLRVFVMESWIVNIIKTAYPPLASIASLLVRTFLYLLKPLFWIMRLIGLLLRLIVQSSLVRALRRLVLFIMRPLSMIAARANYSPDAVLKKIGMYEFKNNFLAIGRGAIKLFKTHKTNKAFTPANSPLKVQAALNASQDIRQRSIPVVYGSPVHRTV